MAWEICITAEGGQEIYHELENWDKGELVVALAADDAEQFEYTDLADLEAYENSRLEHYGKLYHDTLIDIAFERIEQHNTCDNGGNGYYIDRDGYHKVYLKD